MVRQSGWALAALVMVGSASAAARPHAGSSAHQQQQQPQQKAASEGRRDGQHREPWWKDARVIADLALTPEQSSTIDRIFSKYIEKARPLREEVTLLETSLDKTIRAHTMDVPAFAQEVERIETKRAELNKMRTVMLYRLRGVLNKEQNDKFQAMLDRRDAERRKQDGDRRH